MRGLRVLGLVLAGVLLVGFASLGCSGDRVLSSTLEGNMLRYNEVEPVTFTLAGEARCVSCDSKQVTGLLLEVSLKDDPTHILTTAALEGLGDFLVRNITAPKGAAIDVRATLYEGGDLDSPGRDTIVSFDAPGNDGDTVAVTINY